MKNLQILEVKYLGATDTKGSRVKISNNRFKESILVSYDYECNDSLEVALKQITKKHLVLGYNWDEKRNVYNIILEAEKNDFQTLKQLRGAK